MAEFDAGDTFEAIEATFHFLEYVIQLPEVDPENLSFVRILQRVRIDLKETERLAGIPSIKSVLENSPMKLTWIKNGIHNIKSALNDIGLFIERIGSDKDSGADANFPSRVRLVLRNSGKLENQRSELATCHQSLTAILNALVPLEFLSGIRSIDPPPKGLLTAHDTYASDLDSREPGRALSFTREEIDPKMNVYNADNVLSYEVNDGAEHKQRLRSASNITEFYYLPTQLGISFQAEVPRPLFSPPMTAVYSQKRYSHLPSISSCSDTPANEHIRPGPSISTPPPGLSVVTHEEPISLQDGFFDQIPNQRRDALVSPLMSATIPSSFTQGSSTSDIRPWGELTQSDPSWDNLLNSSYGQDALEYPSASYGQPRGQTLAEIESLRIEPEFPADQDLSTRSQSVPSMSFAVELSVEKSRYKPYVPKPDFDAHDSNTCRRSPSSTIDDFNIPSALKPGTLLERSTYPPLSLHSTRPRSTISPTGEVEVEVKAKPVGTPHQLKYTGQPQSILQTERQDTESKIDMPHHRHFIGRTHSTAPPVPEKIVMPHHLHYMASPSPNRLVPMPHHVNYTGKPQSFVATSRQEERPTMPDHSDHLPKPRPPYPTSPGVPLSHISLQPDARNGGNWGGPHMNAQNRRPQSMMEIPQRAYYG